MKSYADKKPRQKRPVNDSKIFPTEAAEQMLVFQWAEWQLGRFPELAWLHHIPNGGSRHPVEAARLKAQGVKPGVPDICLPVPKGRYHGLYIEMKRQKGGRLSEDQGRWLSELSARGYRAVVCPGAESAIRELTEYLQKG